MNPCMQQGKEGKGKEWKGGDAHAGAAYDQLHAYDIPTAGME